MYQVQQLLQQLVQAEARHAQVLNQIAGEEQRAVSQLQQAISRLGAAPGGFAGAFPGGWAPQPGWQQPGPGVAPGPAGISPGFAPSPPITGPISAQPPAWQNWQTAPAVATGFPSVPNPRAIDERQLGQPGQ